MVETQNGSGKISCVVRNGNGGVDLGAILPLADMLVRQPWNDETYRIVEVDHCEGTMLVRRASGGPIEQVLVSLDWITSLDWFAASY